MYVYIHIMYTRVWGFNNAEMQNCKTLYIQTNFMCESSYMFQQKRLKLRAALMGAFFVFNVFVCGTNAIHVRLPYWDLPAIYYWKGIAIFLFFEILIAILHQNVATYYLIAVLQLIYFFRFCNVTISYAPLQYCNTAIM